MPKSYLLIQFSNPIDETTADSPLMQQRLLLANIQNVFGITLEIMGTNRSSHSMEHTGINLSYLLEGRNEKSIESKAHDLIIKLNLMASIQHGRKINPFSFHSIIKEEEMHDITSAKNIFFGIEPKLLREFLHDSNYDEFLGIIEAFEDIENNRIFDAFPKFVNWLDYYNYEEENKPQFKFCSIRSALSHTEIRHAEIVKKRYPDLEFRGNMFIRNDHNQKILNEMIDELVTLVRERFKKILEVQTR